MVLRANPELVLFMDTCTGEIKIEGISCGCKPAVAILDRMRQFRSGLVYDDKVADNIRLALDRRGVKVKSVPGKCINISKDWLAQVLVLMYNGLLGQEMLDRLGYLKHIAEINSEWKNNPGVEIQKQQVKEYWRKVEQYSLAKHAKTTVDQLEHTKNNGLKILIVEDEELSRELMLFYFSTLGKCDIATNGLEAIEAFMMANDEGENYDLITLDIIMPKMDGHEVLRLIRSIEEGRGLAASRIIMTTSMDDAKEIMSSFKNQCDGYLVKPISSEALVKLLLEFNLMPVTEKAPLPVNMAAFPANVHDNSPPFE